MIRHSLLLMLVCAPWMALAEETLPVPPIPPAQGPLEEAPVPDRDAAIPGPDTTRSPVTLDMGIHRREAPDTSRGFAPGSRYQTDETRKPLGLPGFRVYVPFQ